MTQTTDGATQPAVPPVTIAFDLGWQMIALHTALPVRPPAERDLPDRPRNASQLSVPDRFRLRLDAVQFSVTQLASSVDWPTSVHAPDPTAVEAAWTALTTSVGAQATPASAATQPPAYAGSTATAAATKPPPDDGSAEPEPPAQQLKRAVSDFNDELLVRLSGADSRLGHAYSLGHALANTCIHGQSDQELMHNFETHRIGQIYAWLTDLATAFPDHSAKAVAQSLTWWRDTVWVDGTQTTSTVRQPSDAQSAQAPQVQADRPAVASHPTMINEVLGTTAPGLIARPMTISKRRSLLGKKKQVPLTAFVTASAPDLRPQAIALPRQGELWRAVLAGTKNARDLLDADDYISAAQRSLRNAARLARVAVKSAWLFLTVSAGAAVALLVLIGFVSHPTGGTSAGGILVVVVGYVLAGWKVVSPRLAPIATKLETVLLNAELDIAIATAVTLPPAGRPDPSGWTATLSQTT
jgi:hypothetical protein